MWVPLPAGPGHGGVVRGKSLGKERTWVRIQVSPAESAGWESFLFLNVSVTGSLTVVQVGFKLNHLP